MGWFTWSKKENDPQPATAATEGEKTMVEIPKSKFVNEDSPSSIFHSQSKCWPIYELFDRLGEDYETRGNREAKEAKNLSAMDSGKWLISQDIKIVIERILVQYADMLAEVDFEIKNMTDAGMIDTAQRINVTKRQIERHINEIQLKAKSLNDMGSDIYAKVIGSYERGYKIGLMEVSENKITILRNEK